MRRDRRIRPGELAFCCWLTALALALPGLALATEQAVGVARATFVDAAWPTKASGDFPGAPDTSSRPPPIR